MTQTTKNIAVYIRTATTDEAAANKQRIELNEYTTELTLNGEHLEIKEYIDLGYSGNNLERPALTQLVSDSQSGAYDLIVATDLLRFSLNTDDANELIDTFEDVGAAVEFSSDPHLLTEAGYSVDGRKMMAFAKSQHAYYTHVFNVMDEEIAKNNKTD